MKMLSSRDITQEKLEAWGGPEVFASAVALVRKGRVANARFIPATASVEGAVVQGDGYAMKTGFTLLPSGTIKSHCPCRTNQESGMICPHVIALGFQIFLRNFAPATEEARREEMLAAKRAEANGAFGFTRRASGEKVTLSVTWPPDFIERFRNDNIEVNVAFIGGTKHKSVPPERIPAGFPLRLEKKDDCALAILEDVCNGKVTSTVCLGKDDFLNLIDVFYGENQAEVFLKAQLDGNDGTIRISAELEDAPTGIDCGKPAFLVSSQRGFIYSDGMFFRIKRLLPEPFHGIYASDETISRENIPAFLKEELPRLRTFCRVDLSPGEDFFRFIPDTPLIHVHLRGSRYTLVAEVSAVYGKTEIPADAPPSHSFAAMRPDPGDILTYLTRNIQAERAALAEFRNTEMIISHDKPNAFVTDKERTVLNFLAAEIPRLTRKNWRFTFSKNLETFYDSTTILIPEVNVTDTDDGGFEAGYTFKVHKKTVPFAKVQHAMTMHQSFFELDGQTVLVDSYGINSMRGVFADCASISQSSVQGRVKVGGVYAPYVKSILDAIDVCDVDASAAPRWREEAEKRNREQGAKFEPVELGALENVLRPYQKTGVYWMSFLERSGMCGLLADEMGLGKTLQTLSWLSLGRLSGGERKPAIIICPTSLVENWNREAGKFVPDMKCLVVSGPERAGSFSKIKDADLVITSYALVQRDFDEAYENVEFSVAVLDEAQHIKNRTTQNARTVKRLNAERKLALTGTPVENSVSDVWSIFDFLMPGYLGDWESFRLKCEMPIAAGGSAAEEAQDHLRRKLHPFILRRLKTEVAKDLPAKIIKTHFCKMTPSQQNVYNAILASVRKEVKGMVAKEGFSKSRFKILALLMRLRQTCCHIALLKEFREGRLGKMPESEMSGKLEAFCELVDEALDGGHRILVFSQFVSMLSILRDCLEKKKIKYCYLDGSTKDRLGECSKFNSDESIGVFLISLHAGGTGLTLTGADMVIHFDPWWNPAVEAQATDRAHRIGQKRTVYVVKMISENSIEEKVLALQNKKQAVINATVDASDENILEKMSYDDIKEIIGI